jgi:hypothetical protein
LNFSLRSHLKSKINNEISVAILWTSGNYRNFVL